STTTGALSRRVPAQAARTSCRCRTSGARSSRRGCASASLAAAATARSSSRRAPGACAARCRGAEPSFPRARSVRCARRKTSLSRTPLPALAGFLFVVLAGFAQAQTGTRPLKIVVPFPPGNGTDILARLMSPKMTAATGQPVIVENRGGANGQIGAEAVAHAAPDGLTILFTSPSTHVTAQFLSKSLPYDPVKDFTPITAAVEPVTVMTVNPSLPVNSVKELIAYAKANPG